MVKFGGPPNRRLCSAEQLEHVVATALHYIHVCVHDENTIIARFVRIETESIRNET